MLTQIPICNQNAMPTEVSEASLVVAEQLPVPHIPAVDLIPTCDPVETCSTKAGRFFRFPASGVGMKEGRDRDQFAHGKY